MTLEVVVYNIASAIRAQEGGADRIELCDNPGEGGTTPSYGTIEVVRKALNIDVYVMIRPRGGDFLYSNDEYYGMKRDIYQSQRLSVDGVVFGILTADGRIDKKRCKELIEKSRPLKVTCHRAFDMTRDPFEALEDCIEVGFDRILTSGGYTKAIQGIDIIEQLVRQAAGRISIMAGSGVNEEVVTEIVQKSKVKEVHFSAMKMEPGKMGFTNDKLSSMGSNEGSEYVYRTVDPQIVKNIRSLIS
jgi:copper homeostasis protein